MVLVGKLLSLHNLEHISISKHPERYRLFLLIEILVDEKEITINLEKGIINY